jgi:hypothetical protein
MKLFKAKKGMLDLASLPQYALSVGLLVVTVVILAMVIGGIQDQTTADSWEDNISEQGLAGLGTFGDNFDLIVTIVVMVVILGLVVGGFYAFMRPG